jgi:hypothetical protein
MTASMRTVGLDKPCKVCGRPVYFNYKGPVEGVCGRCSDRKRRPSRRRRRGLLRTGEGAPRLSPAVAASLGLLGLLCVAALVLLLLR